MSEPRAVLLLQCLCPARHCIIALAGEAPPATAEEMKDRAVVALEAAIESKAINPWCELCKAPRGFWSFEVAELPGRTLAEIMPELKRQEAAQMQTQAAMKAEDRARRN
jgi:hypothetical protein